MRLAALLALLLPACVSARYAQLQRDEAKQSCEDALTSCQSNWENEMRATDACRQDLADGKGCHSRTKIIDVPASDSR